VADLRAASRYERREIDRRTTPGKLLVELRDMAASLEMPVAAFAAQRS
jgi:hypothetical protein